MSSRSQSQARQLPVPENKTKQDVSFGSKPGKPSGGRGGRGGGGRRRDPPNNYSSAPNPRRGPPPFRGAGGGRGGGGARAKHQQPNHRGLETKYEAVTEADEFEVGSVFKSGSKKQSLNHLLNFQYTPRGNVAENNRRPRENRYSKQHKPVFRPTYSKEQYLQANCQFIVKSSGDYTVHQADPDIPVNWELIEQVHLKTSGTDPLSCPICLFPPTAGKISRCGHVFCWPCILHYLALSDDDYRKCPICYENIQKSDLKSVQVFQQESLATGKVIEMRLMKRERNSLFSVPVNHAGIENFPYVDDSVINQSLSKLVKATPEQVQDQILSRERRELEQQYREEKEQPESVFIKEALILLDSRADECLLLSPEVLSPNEPVSLCSPETDDINVPLETIKVGELQPVMDPFNNLEDVLNSLENVELNEDAQGKKVSKEDLSGAKGSRQRLTSSGSDVSSEGEEMAEDTAVTAEDLDISAVQPVNLESSASKLAPKSTFYFYQDTNGQLIFLHALNIQMLVHEFGSFENCPTTIRAKIVEMDSSTMTEDLRGRLRYLRHLPVSSSFEVAELDLSSIVGKQTMADFKDQIESRKRKRQRKQKAEKVREKRIRREEMRIMGRYPSPMARIESSYHYPKMGESETDGGSSLPRVSSSESLGSSVGSTSAWPAASSQQQHQAPGLNFARVTKKAPTTVAAPAVRPKPAQGMVQLGGPMLASRPRKDSEDEAEPEGYVPPPPTASLGDALAQALARADGSGGNKKKGKKFRGKPISLTSGPPRPVI